MQPRSRPSSTSQALSTVLHTRSNNGARLHQHHGHRVRAASRDGVCMRVRVAPHQLEGRAELGMLVAERHRRRVEDQLARRALRPDGVRRLARDQTWLEGLRERLRPRALRGELGDLALRVGPDLLQACLDPLGRVRPVRKRRAGRRGGCCRIARGGTDIAGCRRAR
jgi:hypothetical protein